MKTKIYLAFILILLGSLGITKSSAAGNTSQYSEQSMGKESLNQPKVHELYNAGDFDPVIAVLEAFIKKNKTYSQSDSIFIAKHLAVVYSANPVTREKGKYYMFKLLEILPSAKLIDMFVSEEVDRIFDKVREEFMGRQHGFGVDTTKIALPSRRNPNQANQNSTSSEAKLAPSSGSSWLLWTSLIGGTALLAGGVYFWYQGQDPAMVPAQEPISIKVITPKN